MKSNPTKSILAVAVIISGFVAIYFLSGFVEKNKPVLAESYADEDLAVQGARLKGFSLGFEGLIADWYWIQSLQYLGNKIVKNPDTKISLDNLNALNPRLLYPYLDNAATLDPKFLGIYEFGSTVLPAIDKEKAVKLLEKGVAANPNEWRLYHQLGFIYWQIGDYTKASDAYTKGASLPDAPKFLELMAAKTKSDGESRETARAIYRQIYEESQDDQTKESARLRLLQYDSLDERDAIRKVLTEYQEKTGKCADNWREIFPLIQKVRLPNGKDLRIDAETFAPVDPTDVPYIFDNKDGKCDVELDYKKSKIPFN